MRFWRAVPLGRTALLNSALVLVLVGGGVWAYFMINGDGTPAAATTVRTVAVAQGKVTATVTADGTVASANTMSADFTTAGTVTAIKVKVGDRVAKGATLATVDATEVNENLATAKRNRTAAAEALDRAEDGGDDSSIANAENQLDQADAAVKSAQRAVDGTVLKAPMAGTVVAISGAVGGSSGGSSGNGSSSSSSGFVQLADLTKLKVSASVAEADATRLKLDQAATIAWNALSGVTATGKVTAISPTASSGNTVAYPIEVTLDSIPEGTRLGQTVSLTVTVDEVEGAVYVPAAAVKTAGGRTTVTVVTNGVQETRAVEIGLKGDSYTVVLSGLEVGEQVVLATVTSTTNNQQQFPGGGPGGFTGGGFGGTGTGGAGTGRGTR